VKTTAIHPATALLLLAAACATATPAPTPTSTRAREGSRSRATPTEGGARATRPTARVAEAPAAASAEAPAEPAADAIPARAQRLFGEALKALDDQKALKVPIDWELMEKKWRAVLGAGEVAEAHFNLGVALDAQGKEAEAKAEYEQALAAKPTLRQAKVNLVVLQERKGDTRGASAAYGEILRDFPEDAMARERLAALYRESGQQDDAWRLAREALLRDPRAIGAYKTMIRIAMARKDLDLAKLIALRAQKLDERDTDLAFLLGEVLDRQGDEAGAMAQWQKTLDLSPGHLPARYGMLEQAVRKEAWPRVSEQAAAILKEDPKNAAVVLLRGIALRHTEKPDEALAAYDKAEKLSGGALPEVYLARGVLLMREKSECEPALVQFDRYVKSVGPILPKGSPVTVLQRECDEMIASNKAAAEAARQMQADAEKAAAAEAAKKAAEGAGGKAPPAGGAK
jgi:tetratricopeptide (TPR) repeat protein